jgi:hypothetical protein
MTTFEYKSWAGNLRRVEADRVEFAPAHVVFRRLDHSIVLAEKNEDVSGLKQLPEAAS